MTPTPLGIVLHHDKIGFTFITREHLKKVTSCQPKHQDDCIVADPAICHSEPTFRATYASCPADVLEQGASGMAWEAIIERRGRTGRGTAYVLKGSNDS